MSDHDCAAVSDTVRAIVVPGTVWRDIISVMQQIHNSRIGHAGTDGRVYCPSYFRCARIDTLVDCINRIPLDGHNNDVSGRR